VTAGTPTPGEIYWDAYAGADPTYLRFGDLGPVHCAAIETGAQAVAEAAIQRRIDSLGPMALPGSHPALRYALVEQMGFRRTYGTVRETEFAGKPMAEVTPLDGTSVRLAAPESLYQVTWLTRDQAERGTGTGAHAVAAIGSGRAPLVGPWGAEYFDDGGTDGDDDGERDTARRMDALDEAARLEAGQHARDMAAEDGDLDDCEPTL
jgi:hypothetical protein